MDAAAPSPGYALLPGRRARFAIDAPGAQRARLIGDFTRWLARALPLARGDDGLWSGTTEPLPEGVRAYKFVLDDTFVADPAHGDRQHDGFGGENSWLLVPPAGVALGGMHAVRVVSLNLHTWQETDARAKLEAVARVLAALGVHAAALQEVGEHRTRPDDFPNAGELLRQRLEALTGTRWAHEHRVAHVGFEVFHEGVSLLSRLSLSDPVCVELSGGFFRRIALSATLGARRPLRLTTVHTAWPGDGGLAQIERLLASLDDARSDLVAGDLNAPPDAPQIERLRAAGFVDVGGPPGARRPTFGGGHGPMTGVIDYQLLRDRPGHFAPLSLTTLFDGRAIGDVAQPLVSDHVGLLGAYAVR